MVSVDCSVPRSFAGSATSLDLLALFLDLNQLALLLRLQSLDSRLLLSGCFPSQVGFGGDQDLVPQFTITFSQIVGLRPMSRRADP